MKKLNLGVFALVVVVVLASATKYSVDRFEVVKNLDILTDVFHKLNTLYVDEVDAGEIMQVGINAMLKSLDPYTVYYPESDIEDYTLMYSGEYAGIGISIQKMDSFVVVTNVVEGYPADKAGLKIADKLLAINGNSLIGKNPSDVSNLIKGNAGTLVKVKLARPTLTGDEELDFEVNRMQLKNKSVPYHAMLNDEIGYIKQVNFNTDVAQEVKDAFMDLKRNQQMKKLIFDLRDNPGGILQEAVSIVNIFMPKNLIVVETKGKLESANHTYKTREKSLDEDIPVVILVNNRSASASEIVSGSLQDFDRAVIIGKDTYGKGLVQTTRDLKYNGKIKITTSKYYTPSGRCIQAIDYSEKDEYGKAIKIPDSLYQEFKTSKGRVVQDGHGVQPDIVVEEAKKSDVVLALLQQNIFFHYATHYTFQHATISSPQEFVFEKTNFEEFIKFLQQKEFDYSTPLDKKIEDLLKTVHGENHEALVKEQVAVIQEKIKTEKSAALLEAERLISFMLQQEIVLRYYYQNGKILNALTTDPFILKASEVLQDTQRYAAILKP